jgi:predicted small lipoprotein YifL
VKAEPRRPYSLGAIGILFAAALLSGCGQRGPLTLPGADESAVAAPADGATQPQSDENDDDDDR